MQYFLFYFNYTASKVSEILESENFLDAEVYLQPPNDGRNSDDDSDSKEETDPQRLSAGQLIAQADFKVDLVHILLIAVWCDDVDNVSDFLDEAYSENEDHLEKEEDFNNALETKRSYVSTNKPLFHIVLEFRIYSERTMVLQTNGFYYAKFSNKMQKW